MQGGTVGEVVASQAPQATRPGDKVVGLGGWQQYSVVDAAQPGALRKVDTTHVPLSAYLGAVGMPGVTAWYGLMKICEPKAGQTDRRQRRQRRGRQRRRPARQGARLPRGRHRRRRRQVRATSTTSSASTPASTTRQHPDPKSLYEALKEASPDGIDGYFENVGGTVLDAVLPRMNAFGRIALCGMISGYDGAADAAEQPQLLLINRLSSKASSSASTWRSGPRR